MDVATISQNHAGADVRPGMDVGLFAHLRRRADISVGGDADLGSCAPRGEVGRDAKEGVLGILDENERGSRVREGGGIRHAVFGKEE